jgi:GDP-4-dehydro-6-deoxy-D-mannose reductase
MMEAGARGRVYNVCSGRAWRMRELLDELLRLATVPIEVAIDPARFRPVDGLVVQGDPSRIQDDLGWSPRIRVEQSLRDTLDDWRARVAADVSA